MSSSGEPDGGDVSVRIAQTESLVDQLVTDIRDQIFTGALTPGEPLHIEVIAREAGVSRTPAREAITKLEAMGLVTRRPNYTPIVSVLSKREVLEFYEMRGVLEPLAAGLALPSVTPALLSELGELVSEMDTYQAGVWARLNLRFHTRLYEFAGRPHLLETIAGLIEKSDPYVRLYFTSNDLHKTQCGHRAILTALHEGDQGELEEAVRSHLSDVVTGIVSLIPEAEQ